MIPYIIYIPDTQFKRELNGKRLLGNEAIGWARTPGFKPSPLPFCLLDTRFESSSWRGWHASSDHGRLFNPSFRASDLVERRKKRTTEIQGGCFFFFFIFYEAATNFLSRIIQPFSFFFLSASAVVFQDCVTWRDFVYFSRENLDIAGVFFFFFLFGILRPRENNVFSTEGKIIFRGLSYRSNYVDNLCPTTLATRSRGGGVSIFVRRDTLWPAPAFRFDPSTLE